MKRSALLFYLHTHYNGFICICEAALAEAQTVGDEGSKRNERRMWLKELSSARITFGGCTIRMRCDGEEFDGTKLSPGRNGAHFHSGKVTEASTMQMISFRW